MKKALSIIIAIVMIALLVGCSKGNNNVSDNVAPTESNKQPTTEHVTTKPTVEQTENASVVIASSETYILSNPYKYLDSHAMNNGIAWANLKNKNSNDNYVGIINSKGEVLYFANNKFESKELVTTPFINSLSALYPQSGDKSLPGFVIVDSKGEEVYSSFDENIYMCGQADNGTFIILKHEYGFDHDGWFICTLDSKLKFTETGIEADNDLLYNHEIKEVAEGLYYFTRNHGLFVNLHSSCVLSFSSDVGTIGYNDDYVCFYPYYKLSHGYYFIPISTLLEIKSKDDLISIMDNDSSIKTFDDSQKKDLDYKDWHNGSFYGVYTEKENDSYKTTNNYWDIEGNVIFTFPEFVDGVRYISIDDFSGQYSAVLLSGVDKNYYVTILDEEGNSQYEPVQVKNDTHCSCNGYIFFHNNKEGLYDTIAPDGSHKKLGDDLSGLEDSKTSYKDNGFSIVIGGGYIFCNDNSNDYKYVSIDGSKTIDSVTASFNKDGKLVYTDENGKKVISASGSNKEPTAAKTNQSTEKNAEPTTVHKNYVTINNFSIIGKWKNVGTYTYGQAQKGSIIVFDGANCNFFSPNDTYAFYKDGDNYRLDCTSPLADTVSFTVKIVDENNIDIVNGSNIVELKRVN